MRTPECGRDLRVPTRSMSTITRRKPTNGMTLVEGLAIIALFMIVAVLLLPPLVSTHKLSPLSDCKSNLRQIGLALEFYRNEVGKRNYPPGGNEILLNHLFTLGKRPVLDGQFGLVRCGFNGPPPPTSAPLSPDQIDYILKAGGSATTSALEGLGSDEPIAIDKPDNHGDEADGADANVLFMDTHVETVTDPEEIARYRSRVLTPGPTTGADRSQPKRTEADGSDGKR